MPLLCVFKKNEKKLSLVLSATLNALNSKISLHQHLISIRGIVLWQKSVSLGFNTLLDIDAKEYKNALMRFHGFACLCETKRSFTSSELLIRSTGIMVKEFPCIKILA